MFIIAVEVKGFSQHIYGYTHLCAVHPSVNSQVAKRQTIFKKKKKNSFAM